MFETSWRLRPGSSWLAMQQVNLMLTTMMLFLGYPPMVLNTMLAVGSFKDSGLWGRSYSMRPRHGRWTRKCSREYRTGSSKTTTNFVEFSSRLGFEVCHYENQCEALLQETSHIKPRNAMTLATVKPANTPSDQITDGFPLCSNED
jgi:hypothetical protein